MTSKVNIIYIFGILIKFRIFIVCLIFLVRCFKIFKWSFFVWEKIKIVNLCGYRATSSWFLHVQMSTKLKILNVIGKLMKFGNFLGCMFFLVLTKNRLFLELVFYRNSGALCCIIYAPKFQKFSKRALHFYFWAT